MTIPSTTIALLSIIPSQFYASDFDLELAVSEALTKLGWTDISFVVERKYNAKKKKLVLTGWVHIYRFRPISYLTERQNSTYGCGKESFEYDYELAHGTTC